MTWRQLALVGLGLVWPLSAQAQPHPWPFDFDSNVAADPAGIEQRLQDLGNGVPAIPANELVATTLDAVTLFFHPDMLELLELARDSGPGLQEYFGRTPTLCAAHAAFVFPSGLLTSSTPHCAQVEQELREVFADQGQSCTRIEFPETFVDDQDPGEVDRDALQNLEGLLRLVGEALRHLDYPAGLLPDNFEQQTRTVLAKIRYSELLSNARARRTAYRAAQNQLHDNASCFDSATAQTLRTTLDTLRAELDAAEQQLEDIHAAGLAQATADRHAVEQQGRLRNTLPFPSLTDREREQLAFYIGGIYWRMRGAGLLAYPPDPDQGLLRRFLYVQYPYQVIADLSGGDAGADFGRDIFIHENWGWGEWFDMGTSPGNDKYSDLVDMTIRGKRGLDLAAPRLRRLDHDDAILYAGGLQMGPCYYYAWYVLRDFRLGEDLQDPYMWFLEGPTAHGEFCTGATLGLGLARALLWGRPNTGCIPDCVNVECGDDGCGGDCPECGPGLDCEQGMCVAVATDAGPVDTRGVDAGRQDAGQTDSVVHDANRVDATTADTRHFEAAVVDTGAADQARDDRGSGTGADAADRPPDPGWGCSALSGKTHSAALCLLLLMWRRKKAT